ncbi:MAG: LPS export ABC transporter periplasmic protein LptC [Betaproteobacteria bacterium RIFCSPLOWO2_02_FULL_67_26]|nr:MAG: LPS export ABC transporter periplasmic protein LptC [Betaproteobacteria bacterium RIFCSPLOWO2_02_FULL_67_26]
MTGDRLTVAAPLLLVGILAALTFWLDRVAQPPARGLGGSRHDPDYIVDNLSAVRMGETGAASYTLSAVKMRHYPDDDTTVLANPKFVSYRSAKASVTITASQAVVSANGEHVYFQDDVRVTRAADRETSELVVRTAFLHVIPDLNLAQTDRTVTITDAATTVTAMGLELNSETRVIKLLSNVRGAYEPGRTPRKDGGR